VKLTPGSAFTVSALACWRVSHLVAKEDGPFDVVLRARARAGSSTLGRLMDCPYCVSVWAAMPLAAWTVRRARLRRRDTLPVLLAISGAACLAEKLTAAPAEVEILEGVTS
jgi:Protein of unknown function (DUF1360)